MHAYKDVSFPSGDSSFFVCSNLHLVESWCHPLVHIDFFSHIFFRQMGINNMNWQSHIVTIWTQVHCTHTEKNQPWILNIKRTFVVFNSRHKWNEITELNGMKLSSYSITKIGSKWLCKLNSAIMDSMDSFLSSRIFKCSKKNCICTQCCEKNKKE